MTWSEKLIARILMTIARMLAQKLEGIGAGELRNELRRLSVDLDAVTIPEPNVFGGGNGGKLEAVE